MRILQLPTCIKDVWFKTHSPTCTYNGFTLSSKPVLFADAAAACDNFGGLALVGDQRKAADAIRYCAGDSTLSKVCLTAASCSMIVRGLIMYVGWEGINRAHGAGFRLLQCMRISIVQRSPMDSMITGFTWQIRPASWCALNSICIAK